MRRAIVLLITLLAASSAFAADLFTIYVPLQFSQINPLVSHVTLRCELRGPHPITTTPATFAAKGSYVWSGSGSPIPMIPLISGAYSGTVTVVFTDADLAAGGVATTAAHYSLVNQATCEFGLRAPDGSMYSPTGASTGPVLGHQDGTVFRNRSTMAVP